MKTDSPVSLRIADAPQALQLFVHGPHDLHVSRSIMERGIWEPYETSLLVALLRPGDVFVDVGANLGYFSILGAALVGDGGAVFAFEPDPANFSLLEANAVLNGLQHTIHPVRAGLADVPGEGELFLCEDNLGDHQIFATQQERVRLPIELVNGSHYLQDKVSQLTLLKVDTQGSEYQVMQGLMPLLRSLPQPPRIIIELTPLSLRQAGASGRALIELLATLGEPLWIIDHVEHRLVASSADELATWCDNVDAVANDSGFMNILVGGMISRESDSTDPLY